MSRDKLLKVRGLLVELCERAGGYLHQTNDHWKIGLQATELIDEVIGAEIVGWGDVLEATESPSFEEYWASPSGSTSVKEEAEAAWQAGVESVPPAWKLRDKVAWQLAAIKTLTATVETLKAERDMVTEEPNGVAEDLD